MLSHVLFGPWYGYMDTDFYTAIATQYPQLISGVFLLDLKAMSRYFKFYVDHSSSLNRLWTFQRVIKFNWDWCS